MSEKTPPSGIEAGDAGLGPTSHSYISQRLRLHYVDWGNPAAPPLILVHGGRDHCRNWDWVAQDLRRDARAFCWSRQGTPASELAHFEIC